jgi:hypothetical protein
MKPISGRCMTIHWISTMTDTMHVTRMAAALLIVLAVAAFPLAAESLQLKGGARVLLLPDLGRLDPYLELQSETPGESGFLGYSSLTAGAYYRLHPNLKAGLFYRVQLGALHNEDWINGGSGWVWADTSGRPESVLIADLTPRFLLEFLPGNGWVVSLKNRYEYNLYNGNQSLYIRPGLTYNHFAQRQVVYAVGLHYASGLGLNFGDNLFYSHQVYVDGLYHLTDALKLQLELSWNRHNYGGQSGSWSWSFSERFIKVEVAAILIPRP